MSTISQNNVIGIFDHSEQAHEALTDLRRAGFRDAELGVLSNFHHTLPHSAEKPIPFMDEEKVEVNQDATTGALVGGRDCGSIGALSLATLMIPGFGPMLVGGFFALLGLGMVGGAMAGGMIGSLIGIGAARATCRSSRAGDPGGIYDRECAHRRQAGRGGRDYGSAWLPVLLKQRRCRRLCNGHEPVQCETSSPLKL